MDIAEHSEVARIEEPTTLPQTVDEPDKAVFENDDIALIIERTDDGTIVAESNNKHNEKTLGCTLIETDSLPEAAKALRVFKLGVRAGSNTQTVV